MASTSSPDSLTDSPPISWPLNRPTHRSPWTPSPSQPNSQQLPNGHTISNGPTTALLANNNNHLLSNGHAGSPTSPPPQLDPSLLPSGPRSLAGTSLRSFLLGLTLGLSTSLTLLLLWTSHPLWRAPFFLCTLSLFHFLEYHTTAQHNPSAATISAFLLSQNGSAYNIAHTLALLECLLPSSPLALLPFAFPHSLLPFDSSSSSLPRTWLLALGFTMMVVGQTTRTLAMAQAGSNFNHTVQMKRREGHELVTDGVYAYLRHPSYFGFWWWGLGTQVVLGNKLCFVGYAVVLWRFFRGRIEREEELLVKFFGDRYVEYRKRTWVGIPFIR